jgi:hypothetical protein
MGTGQPDQTDAQENLVFGGGFGRLDDDLGTSSGWVMPKGPRRGRTMNQLSFWSQFEISAMPMLSALRQAVLARSTKRMPKWKFRVAPDVVLQIQPQPDTQAEEFATAYDCRAMIQEGADGGLFTDKHRPSDCWLIDFRLMERPIPEAPTKMQTDAPDA